MCKGSPRIYEHEHWILAVGGRFVNRLVGNSSSLPQGCKSVFPNALEGDSAPANASRRFFRLPPHRSTGACTRGNLSPHRETLHRIGSGASPVRQTVPPVVRDVLRSGEHCRELRGAFRRSGESSKTAPEAFTAPVKGLSRCCLAFSTPAETSLNPNRVSTGPENSRNIPPDPFSGPARRPRNLHLPIAGPAKGPRKGRASIASEKNASFRSRNPFAEAAASHLHPP